MNYMIETRDDTGRLLHSITSALTLSELLRLLQLFKEEVVATKNRLDYVSKTVDRALEDLAERDKLIETLNAKNNKLRASIEDLHNIKFQNQSRIEALLAKIEDKDERYDKLAKVHELTKQEEAKYRNRYHDLSKGADRTKRLYQDLLQAHNITKKELVKSLDHTKAMYSRSREIDKLNKLLRSNEADRQSQVQRIKQIREELDYQKQYKECFGKKLDLIHEVLEEDTDHAYLASYQTENVKQGEDQTD